MEVPSQDAGIYRWDSTGFEALGRECAAVDLGCVGAERDDSIVILYSPVIIS